MKWMYLNSSVGSKTGKNNSKDVKIVQALLNVYLRSKNKSALKITGKINNETNQTILDFQSKELKRINPDGRIDPGGGTYNALIKILKKSYSNRALIAPNFGIVTWEAEGTEGGVFHSRKLHVPSNSSGLTIGRGYDLRRKKQTTVISDLTSAGLDAKHTEKLKKATGLFGATAKQFIIDNDLLDFEITPEVQKKLFKISYDYEASQVKRISTKKDVEKLYGRCDWDKLDKSIKDIAIDLKFRGDYTSKTRKIVQKSIAENDLAAFKKIIVDKTKWKDVPEDRFKRRKHFIEKAKATTAAKVSPK